MVATKDFWGELDLEMKEQALYFTILKEQAKLLDTKTKGVLKGEIDREFLTERVLVGRVIQEKPVIVIVRFIIHAPKLKNYRVELFNIIQHLDSIFPLTINNLFYSDSDNDDIVVENLEGFEKVISEVLSHHKTKELVRNLAVQSQYSDDLPF